MLDNQSSQIIEVQICEVLPYIYIYILIVEVLLIVIISVSSVSSLKCHRSRHNSFPAVQKRCSTGADDAGQGI